MEEGVFCGGPEEQVQGMQGAVRHRDTWCMCNVLVSITRGVVRDCVDTNECCVHACA